MKRLMMAGLFLVLVAGCNEHIVSYTDEGDPILHDLEFDGILIHSVRDSRRDTFGNGEIMEMTCKKIEHVEDGTMAKNMYNLADCNKNDADDSVLWY
ncbi:DUF4362 domain-containing protein [Rossellomorea sp. y25]|uniref:DUF4362 domain-containing protein n=1 Tax=Rossellomorea sp. y25 TaxID=3118174 RepID=UPI0030E0F6A5